MLKKPTVPTSATSAQLNIQKPRMSMIGSRSLCLYGDSHAGKTETVKFLVEAGFDVHYIDFEHNLDSIISVADSENFSYYPVNNTAGVGIFEFFKTLMRTGVADVCHAHGTHNCKLCAEKGEPFARLDISQATPKTIFVFDSFSAIVRAINDTVVAKSSTKDMLSISDDDVGIGLAYFRAVSAGTVPVWHFINKLPANCGSLVITHEHDKASIFERSPQHFYHPIAGSGSYSVSAVSKTPCTAIWAIKREPVADKRKPILESNLTHYAKTANAADYAGMLLKDAIVKFFSRGN